MPRQQAGHSRAEKSFRDPRQTFTEEQVRQETARCLGCGATYVDEALCVGCGLCTTRCKFDAISLARVYDSPGAAFEDLKPIVVRTVLKRKVKIAAKKVGRALGLRK